MYRVLEVVIVTTADWSADAHRVRSVVQRPVGQRVAVLVLAGLVGVVVLRCVWCMAVGEATADRSWLVVMLMVVNVRVVAVVGVGWWLCYVGPL